MLILPALEIKHEPRATPRREQRARILERAAQREQRRVGAFQLLVCLCDMLWRVSRALRASGAT